MERYVASVAVIRAVLVGRLVIMTATIAASIRLVDDPVRPALALALVTVVTIAQLLLINRHPAILHRRLSALTLEVAMTFAVLAISPASLAYFCYVVGCAMFAGALLGTGCLPLCLASPSGGVRGITPYCGVGATGRHPPGHCCTYG